MSVESQANGHRCASEGNSATDAERGVVVKLLARLFAAIGSYPHIVATRAAPVEMRASMPPKRSENHTVLTPATWALVADGNLFRTVESPFGHRKDGTISISAAATCTTNCERRRGSTAEFPRILSRLARDAMNPQFPQLVHRDRCRGPTPSASNRHRTTGATPGRILFRTRRTSTHRRGSPAHVTRRPQSRRRKGGTYERQHVRRR
jgi:hypothetical protein